MKETADLEWQHEAITSNMKLLTKLLSNLAKQSKRGTTSVQLKKQISLYRWLLYGFQEVVRQHMELDEVVIKNLSGGALPEQITSEHEIIKSEIDNVIRLAENSISYELAQDVLKKCALDISKEVNKICKLIKSHMSKEDTILKKK